MNFVILTNLILLLLSMVSFLFFFFRIQTCHCNPHARREALNDILYSGIGVVVFGLLLSINASFSGGSLIIDIIIVVLLMCFIFALIQRNVSISIFEIFKSILNDIEDLIINTKHRFDKNRFHEKEDYVIEYHCLNGEKANFHAFYRDVKIATIYFDCGDYSYVSHYEEEYLNKFGRTNYLKLSNHSIDCVNNLSGFSFDDFMQRVKKINKQAN